MEAHYKTKIQILPKIIQQRLYPINLPISYHPISSPPRRDAEDGITYRKGAMLTPLTTANSDKQIIMLTMLTATSSRGGPQAEGRGGKLSLKAYL